MSLENAILEHAGAMRELAAAVRALVDSTMGAVVAGTPLRTGAEKVAADRVQGKTDGGKAESADTATGQVDRAALEQAVADAKAEEKRNKAEVDKANAPADLDYNKDVKPALLTAIKKAGKAKVADLIATFGVDKADKVPAEKLGELLAGAQKLAA